MESTVTTELVQKRDREEWERYLRTRSIEDRNRLVELNIAILKSEAWKYFVNLGKPGWTSVDEIESVGITKLIRAVELYNPTLGWQFSTYATWAVRNELTRVVVNEQRELPSYFNAKHREGKPRRVALSTLQDKGWNPSTVDAERAVMTDNWIAKLRKFLPARDHEILMLRYHEGLTLEETGERMGVTRERIRQLESRAIRRLQQETESTLLMENSKPLVGLRVSEFTNDQRPEPKGPTVDNIDPLKILEQITLADVERKIGELETTLDGWKAIYKIVAARSGVATKKKSRTPRAAQPEADTPRGAVVSVSSDQVVDVLKKNGPLQPSEIADRVGCSRQGMHFRLNNIEGIARRDDGAWEAV